MSTYVQPGSKDTCCRIARHNVPRDRTSRHFLAQTLPKTWALLSENLGNDLVFPLELVLSHHGEQPVVLDDVITLLNRS